jgi:hypothetical protein
MILRPLLQKLLRIGGNLTSYGPCLFLETDVHQDDPPLLRSAPIIDDPRLQPTEDRE